MLMIHFVFVAVTSREGEHRSKAECGSLRGVARRRNSVAFDLHIDSCKTASWGRYSRQAITLSGMLGIIEWHEGVFLLHRAIPTLVITAMERVRDSMEWRFLSYTEQLRDHAFDSTNSLSTDDGLLYSLAQG
jgi:hypothetical protein